MSALEKLVAAKGVVGNAEFRERKDAWDRAARATPHGEPIELGRESRPDAPALTGTGDADFTTCSKLHHITVTLRTNS